MSFLLLIEWIPKGLLGLHHKTFTHCATESYVRQQCAVDCNFYEVNGKPVHRVSIRNNQEPMCPNPSSLFWCSSYTATNPPFNCPHQHPIKSRAPPQATQPHKSAFMRQQRAPVQPAKCSGLWPSELPCVCTQRTHLSEAQMSQSENTHHCYDELHRIVSSPWNEWLHFMTWLTAWMTHVHFHRVFVCPVLW